MPLPFDETAVVSLLNTDLELLGFSAADGNVTVTQDLDNHMKLVAPGIEEEGVVGPSSIDVSAPDRGVWVGLRQFAEKWPSELVFNSDARGIGVNLLPAFEDGRYAGFQPRNVNLNLWVIDGKLAGTNIRASTNSIINVSQGGGIGPSFYVNGPNRT